jgi:hypothetical protein
MTNDPNPSAQFDALRLEVDRLRLGVEQSKQANELARTFLERWRTEVQPVHEHRMKSRDQAYGLGKTAIQTGFLLNGGALIAFPAFAQLVGKEFENHIEGSIASIGLFITGLVLIGVCTALSSTSFGEDAEALAYREEYVKSRLHFNNTFDASKATHEEAQRKAESSRAKHHRRANSFLRWAMAAGIGSLVVFVAGALCAMQVLSAASSG